ncbi:MAG TPA: hypothetical protein VJ124_10305 [Pyrinomonadaceae bacterium]|nr:hypothetical protein [Pyrinomonadaceae bacterium]
MKTMLGGFAMLLLGVEEDQRNQVLAEIGGERRRERVERKALDGGSRSKFDFPYELVVQLHELITDKVALNEPNLPQAKSERSLYLKLVIRMS